MLWWGGPLGLGSPVRVSWAIEPQFPRLRNGVVVGALQMPVSDPLTPPVLPTAPEAAPGCVGDMAETPRDAGLKQALAPRNEKAPADFGYVGIDSILEQMRRKAMKQGFEFNIMVVGECAPHAGTPHRGLWGSVRSSEDGGGRTWPAGRMARGTEREPVCAPACARVPAGRAAAH